MKKFLFILAFATFHKPGHSQKININDLITLKKGNTEFDIPIIKKGQFLFSFNIIDPGFPVIPLNGGIFLAGFNTWLAKPQDPMVMAIAQNLNDPDSSIIVLKANTRDKKILLQKVNDLKKVRLQKSMMHIPYGLYDLVSVDKSLFYLYGVDSTGSHLWQSDFTGLYPVFNTSAAIHDMNVINENNVVMAVDSSLVIVGLQQAPKEILKLDLAIDGVAIDTDGSVFVSTKKGILHYHSLDEDDFDIITHKIHGKLKSYHNRLYVLWREKSSIIEIKLR